MFRSDVKSHIKKSLSAALMTVFLLVNLSALSAQTVVASDVRAAGFRFSASSVNNKSTVDGSVVEPVVHYQQNIQMLSSVDDQPSVRIFGSGRVLVHYPVYMKKAGDYEMQLDEVELVDLVGSLASNGIMDFDEKKVKEKVKADKKASKVKGQFFAISDAVVTIVDIRLDEYQKNRSSNSQTNFRKQFKWENIEHDAVRYKNNSELIKANNSIRRLKLLMSDARLVKKGQR